MAGQKFDEGKLRYELIGPEFLRELAGVLTMGAEKYGSYNWMGVPHAVGRYNGALMRHFEAYRDGELKDPESGLSHLAHVACNAMFLLHFEEDINEDSVVRGHGSKDCEVDEGPCAPSEDVPDPDTVKENKALRACLREITEISADGAARNATRVRICRILARRNLAELAGANYET